MDEVFEKFRSIYYEKSKVIKKDNDFYTLSKIAGINYYPMKIIKIQEGIKFSKSVNNIYLIKMKKGQSYSYMFYYEIENIKARVYQNQRGICSIKILNNGIWRDLTNGIKNIKEEFITKINDVAYEMVFYLNKKSGERISILLNKELI